MTNTIFCLSLPGGHMSYIGVLSKLLLRHLSIEKNLITFIGSAHGADGYFPPNIPHNFKFKNWDSWFVYNLKNFSYNDTCVFKDSWINFTQDQWEKKLNFLEKTICLISSPKAKIDWYYAWISLMHKMPTSLYGHLKLKSPLFPIWHMLNNKHKFNALLKTMPVFPIKENIKLTCDHLRFATTDILEKDFPLKIHNFLIEHNHKSLITNEIFNYHNYFISKQKQNYELALQLDQNIRWEPRNMFDKILFDWIDTNPWGE
jgi:hypothetical protein